MNAHRQAAKQGMLAAACAAAVAAAGVAVRTEWLSGQQLEKLRQLA